MRSLRFRLASVVVLVAVAALNLGAVRWVMDNRGPTEEALGMGVIPMVNILAFCGVIGLRRRENRAFMLGCVACGAAALFLYIVVAIRSPESLEWYFELVVTPLKATLGRGGWTTSRLALAYVVLSMWIVMPQLAFALVGGWVSRNLGHVRHPGFEDPRRH